VTQLRQMMLEELARRNYAPTTVKSYLRTLTHFARYFNRAPDQLGPAHIRQYQAALFTRWKLSPNTVAQRLAWPVIASGDNLLLSAPTGSGKTLAAFLP